MKVEHGIGYSKIKSDDGYAVSYVSADDSNFGEVVFAEKESGAFGPVNFAPWNGQRAEHTARKSHTVFAERRSNLAALNSGENIFVVGKYGETLTRVTKTSRSPGSYSSSSSS